MTAVSPVPPACERSNHKPKCNGLWSVLTVELNVTNGGFENKSEACRDCVIICKP